MKKRKQHHVWKAYLRAWATKEKLWVLQDGRIRSADIEDVAVQHDFYKLNTLTATDVEFIRKIFIAPLRPHARRVAENYMAMFSMWVTLRESVSDEQAAANPELAKFLEEQIINAEEDFHSGMEERVAPLIETARKGDIGFFGNERHAMILVHFLSVQNFRTSGVKARVIKRFREKMNFDISRSWNIISHILATAVGSSLYVERRDRPLILLENSTDRPFITSDQPTVNLLGGDCDDKSPEYLALYYPISPKYALLLDEPGHSCGFANRSLTTADIQKLNEAEAKGSYRQVFSGSEATLGMYKAAI